MSGITTDELQKLRPIVISVIGPTNEGKTSVLRTLTGDPNFGEVNAYSGTTVVVEIQKVIYKGAELLQLVDTPGFQMSGEILDRLQKSPSDENTSFSPEAILAAIPKEEKYYRHDLKAWREVLRADIILLVANIMESPKQSLIQNTLTLLANIRKPLIVVFNYVNDSLQNAVPPDESDYQSLWIEELKKRGLFLYQVYDAHNRNFKNELDLFEKILVHIEDPIARKVLKQEMRERLFREQRRMALSRKILARFLFDVASYRQTAENVAAPDKEQITKDLCERFNEELCMKEHQAHVDILAAWDFKPGILERILVPFETDSRERKDLFSDTAWKEYVSGAKTGAAVGAGVGLILDIALAGLSLGTGTLIGGLIGGLLGTGINGFHHFSYDEHKKIISICPRKSVLILLFSRAVALIKKLQARGKALEDGVQISISRTPDLVVDKECLRIFQMAIDVQTGKKHLPFFGNKKVDREEQILSLSKRLEEILPSPSEVF